MIGYYGMPFKFLFISQHKIIIDTLNVSKEQTLTIPYHIFNALKVAKNNQCLAFN